MATSALASSLDGSAISSSNFVIVPAIVLVGCAVACVLWPTLGSDCVPEGAARGDLTGPQQRIRRRRCAASLLFLVLCASALYNGFLWLKLYGRGVDDSYAYVIDYVRTHVPPGATIVVGSDVSNYFLRPTYDIPFYRDRRTVRGGGVQYFILSSKEACGGYHRVQPDFYHWVRRETRPLLELNGRTFWTLGVYYRELGAFEARAERSGSSGVCAASGAAQPAASQPARGAERAHPPALAPHSGLPLREILIPAAGHARPSPETLPWLLGGAGDAQRGRSATAVPRSAAAGGVRQGEPSGAR